MGCICPCIEKNIEKELLSENIEIIIINWESVSIEYAINKKNKRIKSNSSGRLLLSVFFFFFII